MTRAILNRRHCLALLGAGTGTAWSAEPQDSSMRLSGPLPLVFAVHVSVPARDVAEFARYARSIPAGIAYGSTGVGSSLHVAAQRLIERRLNLRAAHVPYRSLESLTHDLTSGHIHAAFGVAAAFAPFARSRLRILGVGGSARLPTLPQVTTFAEQGFDDAALEARVLLATLAPQGERR